MLHVLLAGALLAAAEPPTVTVTSDNTRITSSCRVVIPPGTIIPDVDGNGVIQIEGTDIEVEFAPGSILRGADVGVGSGQTPWDRLTGTGIVANACRGLKLRGARVSGFRVGAYIHGGASVEIERGEFADNYRQHLSSTPQAEDGGDWLWPHENDGREWMTNYGAGLVLERVDGVGVSGVRVRRGQNGIILDRVTKAVVRGNDASFLSGWGLAMWRSTDNLIEGNAFDFCVRGHSEGVYNRGQDSAGILMFECCQRNRFIRNSATHGGDGFFGFAGKEAIGEKPAVDGRADYSVVASRENVFEGNDFSYAAAHGLELTFSERDVVRRNRFVENAICGIWGGYSNGWTIEDNIFERNGGMGYGLERGAINIEHGGRHVIRGNDFINNAVAVHLWWDDDSNLLKLPGVKSRYVGPRENQITHNRIVLDAANPVPSFREAQTRLVGLRLRDTGQGHLAGNLFAGNEVTVAASGAQELDIPAGVALARELPLADAKPVASVPFAAAPPVGARDALRGRDRIIMDEWGPWDHESPMIRRFGRGEFGERWQVFGVPGTTAKVEGTNAQLRTRVTEACVEFDVAPAGPGVCRYTISFDLAGRHESREGLLLGTTWDCTVFPSPVDPRQDPQGWLAGATAATAVHATLAGPLDLPLGRGGPKAVTAWKDIAGLPGPNHYGLIAGTKLSLPAGSWRFRMLSDDGVRVTVTPAHGERATIIENWTWHGPTTDQGMLNLQEPDEVEVRVEYFQLDGYAALKLDIEPG